MDTTKIREKLKSDGDRTNDFDDSEWTDETRSQQTADERLHRRDIRFRVLGREQRGLVTQAAVKRRKTCGRRWKRIVRIFCPGELLGPGCGIAMGETAEDATDNLVGPFGLTIWLWVKTRGKASRSPDQIIPSKKSSKNSFQNCEANCSPLSETMSEGRP